MELAWLAPVLPAGAFALNVLVWRQMGQARHLLSSLTTLAGIGGAFLVFLQVFGDAQANLEETASGPARHLILEGLRWFSIGSGGTASIFAPTLVIDWLSIMMLGVVTFLAFLIEVYATGYMKGDNRYWWFFSVKALFTAAMLGGTREQAQRALKHYFSPGNLTALRELALRRMADRIGGDVQAYRVEKSIGAVWKTGTTLLACIGARPGGGGRLVLSARSGLDEDQHHRRQCG